MVNLKIDEQNISVPTGTTILKAAEQVGIYIPHLCFLEGINDIGACRVCLVELKGYDRLVTSCNTPVSEGMEIFTNSPKVRETRKINVQLILSDHECNCAICSRSSNCKLQQVANNLGILSVPYKKTPEHGKWNKDFPLQRDTTKCIKCMRCIQVCDKIQGMNVWDICGSGYRTTVGVKSNNDIKDTKCTLCGQCVTHCPVGALKVKDELDQMYEALADPDKITIIQIAPAVRTAWGEMLNMYKEESTLGRLISALRRIGFDYIFDTCYAADMTIMEEGTEFIQRFKNRKEYKWPMFTSCCPGWMRFVKTEYPELIPNLSTTKSPQQIFGALSKTYIAQRLGIDPSKIFSVSAMPCVAKKYESTVPSINSTDYAPDVDLVLTTRGISRLIKADHIKPDDLVEETFDEIFGESSGAGVIFGATGGVMEAALRSAHFLLTGNNPNPDSFKKIRGVKGWKEASFEIEGIGIKVAVVSGLANARELVEAIKNQEVSYDFVEVMACPGGCSGGGGQAITDGIEMAEPRGKILYGLDFSKDIRFSHENPAVLETYKDFLTEPLSKRSHELLHTNLEDWIL